MISGIKILSGFSVIMNKPNIIITQQPTGASISVNSNYKINIKSNITSGVEYQWYKNFIKIDGATASTYQISNASSTDSGSYYCILSKATTYVKSNTVSIVVT